MPSHFLRTVAALALLPAMASCSTEPAADDRPVPAENADARVPSAPESAPKPAPEPAQVERHLRPELEGALQMIHQGRMQQARLELQRRIREDPEDGQAEFLFGLSFQLEDRYDRASRHFERARDLSPHYHPVHHFLAWSYFYRGMHDEARAAFEEHLSLMPSEGDSHFGLGLIALDADDLDEAERHFKQAIALQEHLPHRQDGAGKAHGKLGVVHIRGGDIDLARQHLETAVRLYPDDYESWYQLSRVLLRRGEEQAAEQALAEHEAARTRVQGQARPDPSGVPDER